MPRPIITFLSDFGLSDSYVAEMKAAALVNCPDATLIDITHLIPPQDILKGAIILDRAIRGFPAGTVHVAVVDPGVGSDRRIIMAEIDEQTIFAPDNGLITWVYLRSKKKRVSELLWRPEVASNVFHGRDILAPAAAQHAMGHLQSELFKPISDPVLLPQRPASQLSEAMIIDVDHFGNLITNVDASLLNATSTIYGIGQIKKCYADVAIGETLALIGSSGLLEIAVRNGSASQQLKLSVGSRIEIA